MKGVGHALDDTVLCPESAALSSSLTIDRVSPNREDKIEVAVVSFADCSPPDNPWKIASVPLKAAEADSGSCQFTVPIPDHFRQQDSFWPWQQFSDIR